MSNRNSQASARLTGSARPTTTSSKKSGPYDANYELKLAQAGVHTSPERDESGNRVLPSNYNEVMERLKRPRASLSPSRFTDHDFEKFQTRAESGKLEAEAMQQLVAVIEGDQEHLSRMGGLFNNLELFDPTIATAVPDTYDGAPPLSIDHRVLNNIHRHIVPSTDTSRPAVPNFFLEGKSRKGQGEVAKRQAAHNGAIGARGMISLQSYPNSVMQYDGNAYSFTNTYCDGTLKMYTTHATAPKALDHPTYYMTQLRTFAMTDTSQTFREGATHLRNARDLAKEQRDSFITKANRVARAASKRTVTNAITVPLDEETSADELAGGPVTLSPTKRSRSARKTR